MLGAAAPRAEPSLTVVELFTSQGCSSCPPADAFLGELAERDDVLALSQHVDYWDYLGWKDPFARPEATQRQRDYAARFGLSYVYTPQMVIHGDKQVTGSDRRGVLSRLAKSGESSGPAVDMRRESDGNIVVSIGAMPETAAPGDPQLIGETDVWLAFFDERHTTDVRRGENRGRRLDYFNVVRDFRHIGTWNGEAMVFPIRVADADSLGDGCAVIVQQKNTGRILGAARLHLASR